LAQSIYGGRIVLDERRMWITKSFRESMIRDEGVGAEFKTRGCFPRGKNA